MTVHYFFESLLSVTYTNRVTHGEFYLVDYTSRSAFIFVDAFFLTLNGREQLHFLSIKSLENIPRPILAARSAFSNSAKLLNLW